MPVADLPLPVRTRGLESNPCASEERPPSRFGVRGQGGDHPLSSSTHWSIGRATSSHCRIPSRSLIGEPAFTLSDIYAQPLCVVVWLSRPSGRRRAATGFGGVLCR